MTGLRAVTGLLVGAIAAAIGAILLGEYTFSPLVALGVGLVFGMALAEVVVGVGGRRSLAMAVVTAALAAAGLLWAGWIASGEGLEPLPASTWVAVGAAAAVAVWRAGQWRRPHPSAG